MFWRIFKTSLKITLSDRMTVFWTIGFPLILATLFNAAFAGINDHANFTSVPVAVVSNASSSTLNDTLKPLSEGDEPTLKLQSVDSHDDGITLLEDKTVDGIIEMKDATPVVTVRGENGDVNETIIKMSVDSTLEIQNTIKDAILYNPAILTNGALNSVGSTNFIHDTTDSDIDRTAIYFYTLIGMACLYAGFLGVITVSRQQANLSALGARLTMTPVPRSITLLADLASSYLIALITQGLLFIYLTQFLGVSFGDTGWAVALIMAIGSMAGLAIGTLAGAVSKQSESVKINILIVVTMFCSMLAGMMGTQQLKHLIDQHVPVLGAINPVNNISDALLSIYYYGIGQHYWLDVLYLCLITLTAIVASWWILRRSRYASL